MSLKHGILGLLSYTPMAGYDLMKVFNKSLGFFWTAQTSQIYRDLDSLAGAGFIELHAEVQRGKRLKSVYSITESGRAELNGWLASEERDPGTFRSVFLLRLFFQGHAGTDSLRKMLQGKKTQAEEDAAKLRAIIGAKGGSSDIDELTKLCWSMTAEYGIRQFETEARWAEEYLALLDAFEGRNHEESAADKREPPGRTVGEL